MVGIVELAQVASRFAAPVATRRIAERLTQISLTPEIATLAGQIQPLRTLDAIHVASAAALTDLTALVTYDDRMVTAAASLGLPVISPGR